MEDGQNGAPPACVCLHVSPRELCRRLPTPYPWPKQNDLAMQVALASLGFWEDPRFLVLVDPHLQDPTAINTLALSIERTRESGHPHVANRCLHLELHLLGACASLQAGW